MQRICQNTKNETNKRKFQITKKKNPEETENRDQYKTSQKYNNQKRFEAHIKPPKTNTPESHQTTTNDQAPPPYQNSDLVLIY